MQFRLHSDAKLLVVIHMSERMPHYTLRRAKYLNASDEKRTLKSANKFWTQTRPWKRLLISIDYTEKHLYDIAKSDHKIFNKTTQVYKSL